jgi:hypothetical protein
MNLMKNKQLIRTMQPNYFAVRNTTAVTQNESRQVSIDNEWGKEKGCKVIFHPIML